ncbi:multiple sugar transport system permease protein [Hydrogenispora ethanolica]|uniref:Multiple sugar transport system permease protein n=1 Tax=Hydrogenispora ethanolica TaxID=1082276 RepID=A0A4R1SAP9_HYDET|nr:sugar ABC transporter permease [Hydrogenispora ethanolica]TCL76551.1 multiple sugar transport system permease protein [Hydrogenispora ethanolica]
MKSKSFRFSLTENHEKVLLVLPIVVVLLLFTTFPYLMTLILGFFKVDMANPGGNRFLGLLNYINVFSDPRFWNSMKVSAVFVSVGTILELIFGVALALLLQQLNRRRAIYQSLLLIPMVVPPIVVGLNWRMLYDPNYGIINYFFSLLNIPPQTWLSQPLFALPALLVVDIWQYTPFVTLLVLALLMNLPEDQYEAARIDGASGWQMTWHITIPMIKAGLTVVATLRAIEAFREFAKIYTLTSGGPGIATETLNYYVYITGFEQYRVGYSSALATILFTCAIGFTLLMLLLTKTSSEGGTNE